MLIRSLSALVLMSLAVALFLAEPPQTLAHQKPALGRRVAVLVGTDSYTDTAFPSLKYCEKDMLKLKATLESLGFKVILLLGSGSGASEATQKNIVDTLINDDESNTKYAFRDITEREDIALVAFSGHGQQIIVKQAGKDVEVPFYCPKRAKSGVPETLISINDVLGKLNGGKAKSLLLVDACRKFTERRELDGTKSARGLSLDRSVINDLRKNVGGMFACDDRQEAMEHEIAGGGHGLFFYSVIESIKTTPRDENGVVTWEDLVPRIRKKVEALTEKVPNLPERDRQTPQVFGNFNSSIVLVPPALAGAYQTETYEWQGKERTRKVMTLNLGGEKMEFVEVPAGNFLMGSPESDKDASADEKPQHRVTFTRPLWVAKYPVTKGQFAAFFQAAKYKTEAEKDAEGGFGYDTDTNKFEQKPKYNWKNTGWEQTERHPVVNVTWNDAKAYCVWAAGESGKAIRLLSESEYEYANRGGSTTRYITGDRVESLDGYANIADRSLKAKLKDVTVADFDDGEVFSSRVGKYKPNGFGLYDMTGNVWSWCADGYDEKLYARGDVTDPKAVDSEQKSRVLRGGSWSDTPQDCRAAYRLRLEPGYRLNTIGFRVAFRLDS